jgi:sigma54-dependent transcription regulator
MSWNHTPGAQVNDADRLRKYLARFALTCEQIQPHNAAGR